MHTKTQTTHIHKIYQQTHIHIHALALTHLFADFTYKQRTQIVTNNLFTVITSKLINILLS